MRKNQTQVITAERSRALWDPAHERDPEAGQSRHGAEGITPPEYLETPGKTIPAGRLGTPEELANVIVFLGSERASYISGTTVNVDGGLMKGII